MRKNVVDKNFQKRFLFSSIFFLCPGRQLELSKLDESKSHSFTWTSHISTNPGNMCFSLLTGYLNSYTCEEKWPRRGEGGRNG